MKQLVILSGKGGTGKTAVAAAFTHLAHADADLSGAVAVDADVDAANLELVLGPRRAGLGRQKMGCRLYTAYRSGGHC